MLKFIKSFFTPQDENTTNLDFPYDNKEGIVEKHICPNRKSRVYFNGTWWPARCAENVILEPGEIVNVVKIENITVWVKPFSPK
ncbi:NfeD family protein [Argonema antarcticum]|uniref:NfeD family protein n=1 Tax=Argonema antarcticum TaxID=2942763 RepID=UPI002013A5B4|nr:NfeD family protein [Argonema antarcticum]MCL1469218.1 NfeD family protein [Argonema antarcticum A004/B2]